MPFGLGLGELLFVLMIFAIPAALVVLVARAVMKTARSSRNAEDQERQRLAAELQQAQHRIGELEARLTRPGESGWRA
jgi:Tfp pilus assembly protein PilX